MPTHARRGRGAYFYSTQATFFWLIYSAALSITGSVCVCIEKKRDSENKCSCTAELEWNPSLNGGNFTHVYWEIRRISPFSPPSIGIGVWSGHAFCFNLGDETAEPFARWWWFTTGRSLKNEEAFFSKDTKKIEERPRRSTGRDLCMGKGRRKEDNPSLMNKNRVKWSTRHARGEIWTIAIMTAVCARTRSIRTKWSTSPLEHLNWNIFFICNSQERGFPCFLRVANGAQVPCKFSSPPSFDSNGYFTTFPSAALNYFRSGSIALIIFNGIMLSVTGFASRQAGSQTCSQPEGSH